MRLYIQDKDNLLKFNLPSKIDGSVLFSFLSSNGIENSINVDAIDNKWVIKSNGNVNIIDNNSNAVLDEIVLDNYKCLKISISGISDYLYVFCLPSIEKNIYNYNVSGITSISIGKSSDNNIIYRQGLMMEKHAIIMFEKNNWFIMPYSGNDSYIYVNNQRVVSPTPIFGGDIIFI